MKVKNREYWRYEMELALLYAIEVRSLGRWQAMARLLLDRDQLNVTRERDVES